METDNDRNNRILIVDDEENIHQDFEDTLKPILAKTLTDDLAKEFGSRVDENPLPEFELLHARSGKEAYEKVKTSLEENNPIAVVFMDIKMKPFWWFRIGYLNSPIYALRSS